MCASHVSTLSALLVHKAKLEKKYKMTDLGEAHWILGMRLQRKEYGYRLDQQLYCENILKKYNMQECKVAKVPAQSGLYLSKSDCPTTRAERLEMQDKPYRELVGSLLYLTLSTRPGIAYAVRAASRFCENPGLEH